jgi:hypothetical protein
MMTCTLGHDKDVSGGPAVSMFSAENSVDEMNRFLNRMLSVFLLHCVTSQIA